VPSILARFVPVAFAAALWAGPAAADFRIQSLDNDIRAEAEAAAKEGKRLVVMFHQSGCPYCDKMRDRVFPDPKVDAFYGKHFVMMETNIRGELPLVAPDGTQTVEKEFARSLRVRATPVFVYFDGAGKDVLRITGYFDPDAFVAAGRYVVDEVYKGEMSLARYMSGAGK
jgi:thioredoxin-related protein